MNEYVNGVLTDTAQVSYSDVIRSTSDSWYISDDRVAFNAENEANTVMNYSDFQAAKAKGFTKKRWIAMQDEKVRLSHQEVDEQVLHIDEFFIVGDVLMRYPKDIEYSADFPEQYINCRCSVEYF